MAPMNAINKEAVVVVDPFSTGMCLAEQVMERGYDCIAVYSDLEHNIVDWIKSISLSIREKFCKEIFTDSNDQSENYLCEIIQSIRQSGRIIAGVIAGAEPGVPLTDRISERMGLTSNGSAWSEGRRNKYVMGEAIRQAGLRAVKQCLSSEWKEVECYILQELKPEPFRVIVKPVDSGGSDDVTLCKSMEEVKKSFLNVLGKVNHLGSQNTQVLVQEYLEGTEYVVDTVSCNGVHKVIAVWEYDKRDANGASFVYYGAILREVKGQLLTSIVDYIMRVLDVMHIRHGPGHAEVKFVKGEPCLIEIGARCHGREGTDMPILDRCQGYNQVGATLDSYFDKFAFQKLPKYPTKLQAHGIKTTLVSYEHGTLLALPGLKEIEAMPSYVDKKMRHVPGDRIAPTIDMYTTPGCVLMVHQSEELLQKDYQRVRELEICGLYKLENASNKNISNKNVIAEKVIHQVSDLDNERSSAMNILVASS